MKRSASVLLALGGLAVVACQLVAGIERVDKEQRDVLDGGSTTDAGDGATESVDPCKRVHPSPPPANDDGDVNLPPFYLAVHTIKLIPDVLDAYQGFDLDDVCTCDKRPETASAGASSCAPKNFDCDSDGGVDNAGVALFNTFSNAGFSADEAANKDITKGKRGLLLYIANYNGKANDREVTVGGMISHGILDGAGCGTAVDNSRAPPGWCGMDRWTYPVAYARPSSKEPRFEQTGWVNNGELVFNATDKDLTMFLGGSILTLGSPVGAGRLEKMKNVSGGESWRLTGVLAGRIPVTDLLAAAGGAKDKDDNPLCTNATLFEGILKPTLCKTVDISHTSRFDFMKLPNGGPVPCNAISAGIQFTADEASVGEEHSELDEVGPCSVSSVAASKYTCSP